MKIKSSVVRSSATIFTATVLFGAISLGPESPSAKGQAAAAVALAPLILKALPSIATVVGNLFKPSTKDKQSDEQKNKVNKMQSDSTKGGQQLEVYVKRTQIVATIVGSSGDASKSLAQMIQDIGGKTKLDQSDINDLAKEDWPTVIAALDAIVDSKPDLKAFEGDSTTTLAIKNIMDKGLRNRITAQLVYDPAKPDPKQVANLQKNLVELQSRFILIGQLASVELQFVSDGLAEISATAQSSKPDDVKPKANSIKKSAFTNGVQLHDKAMANEDKLRIEVLNPAPLA